MHNRLLLVFMLFLSGCATQSTLQIYSQPVGAYITEVGTSTTLGIAPTAAYYNASALNQNKQPDGCYLVKGFTAKWVSGATASMNPIRLCGSNTGTYNITLNRGNEHPDLEKDLNFALQVQNMLAQQRQAQAAQNAAFAQMWSAYSISQGVNKTTNCTTTALGNSLNTSCR